MVTARQDDHVENVPRLIEGEHHHHYHVAAYEDDVKDRLDSELLACHDRGCVADVERGELHSPQGHTREFWGLHNLRSCSVRLWPFLQHMSMCKLGSSGIKGRIGRLLNCVLWHGCDRVGLSKPSHDSSHQASRLERPVLDRIVNSNGFEDREVLLGLCYIYRSMDLGGQLVLAKHLGRLQLA